MAKPDPGSTRATVFKVHRLEPTVSLTLRSANYKSRADLRGYSVHGIDGNHPSYALKLCLCCWGHSISNYFNKVCLLSLPPSIIRVCQEQGRGEDLYIRGGISNVTASRHTHVGFVVYAGSESLAKIPLSRSRD